MPWSSSNRASRLPSDWPKRRAQTKKRAGGQCEAIDNGTRCPAPGTDCDHIQRGDNHELRNLQWLCRPHHKRKTQAEALEARPSRFRPPEQHPGLI